MAKFHKRGRNRGDHAGRSDFYESVASPPMESTGAEAEFLKSLVDTRARVTVVLRTGERLQGRIRYYDRDCFSLGPSAGGPKIFLRKSSVQYIEEGE
jgi:sRNA-binding regulator protein Hfq